MRVTMTASSLSGQYWLKGHIFPVINILNQSIKGSICFSWIKAHFLFFQLLIFLGSRRGEAQNTIPKPWILPLALPKIVQMTLGKLLRADTRFCVCIYDRVNNPSSGLMNTQQILDESSNHWIDSGASVSLTSMNRLFFSPQMTGQSFPGFDLKFY